jgi:hypothetical protein
MRARRVAFGGLAAIFGLILVAGPAAAQGVTNLAAREAGGHLVFFSGQYDDSQWKAEHLIDGSPQQGWAGQNKGAQSVIIAFKDDPKLELIIEGHTDNVGGRDFNLDLSRKRAEAVKRWLADKEGISEVRLATVGYGLTRPVADNGTEDGRGQNRRVELLKK